MPSSMFMGANFCVNVAAFIANVGTIMTLFLFMPLIASLTHLSALIPFKANTTSALSLNSVSTGPGHRAHTCTRLPIPLSSVATALVRLTTYAFVA